MTARVLLFCALVYLVVADGNVIELTDKTFSDEVKKHDIMLVEFFAPWCGHCKRLAPEYEDAATDLMATDPPVPLAKVDCTEHKDTCSKFGVSGYPTLKIFRNGELSSDYGGPRERDGIVKYMTKQAAPSAKELTTVEEVQRFLDNAELSVLGFFANQDKLYEVFVKTANGLRENFRFGYSSAADVLEEYGYQSDVVLFQPPRVQNKVEESRIRYPGTADSKELEKWIRATFPGLVGLITTDNQNLFSDKRPMVTVYFQIDYKLNPKGTNYWRNRILKVAKDFREMQFAMGDIKEFGRELSDKFGVEDHSDKDALIATIVDADEKKYRMEGSFSVDSFREFVQQFVDGKLEPYLKSELVPEANDGPVKVVVAKNFDEIVNDPTKDVLIEFYAPWCGHCKTLAPKFDELGEKLKDDPNIVIAKMDATANEAQKGYEVRGFPTLYWAPIGKKDSPQKYEGGREVSDFISFIKKEATNPPVLAGEAKTSKEDL